MVAKARRLLATDTHTTHAAHDLHRDPSGQLGHVAAVAKTCPPVFPTFRDFGLHWFTRAQETQNELQKGHFIREGEGGGTKRVQEGHPSSQSESQSTKRSPIVLVPGRHDDDEADRDLSIMVVARENSERG